MPELTQQIAAARKCIEQRLQQEAAMTPGPWPEFESEGENIMGDVIAVEVVDQQMFPVASCPMAAIMPGYTEVTGHAHWADGPGEAFIERDPAEVYANAAGIAAMRNERRALLLIADEVLDCCQRLGEHAPLSLRLYTLARLREAGILEAGE